LVAMLFTLVAVIVVITRDEAPAKASAKQIAPISDHVVRATDVVRLRRDDVEVVVEKGDTKGLRVKDVELAKSLGLEPGDVITAISGKPMMREADSYDVILKLSLMNATTMYVEVARKDQATLLRWKLDGDLRQARYASPSSSGLFGGNPYTPPSYTPPSTIDPFAAPHPSAPDPLDSLLDTIEQIDVTHVRVPRKTVDAVLANPMA